MAKIKIKSRLAGLLFIPIVLVVIAAVGWFVFFAPGETYTVHVTVTNNAPAGSSHSSVYIGNNIYKIGSDKTISSNYHFNPGQTRTFDLSTKFAANSTPIYHIEVVDGKTRIDTLDYSPTQKESSVALSWDGNDLTIVS